MGSGDSPLSRLPGWTLAAVIGGGALLYGLGSVLWYRFVTAGANRPEISENCALGSYDAAAMRALIARVQKEGAAGGGGCGGADYPFTCFRELLKARIAAVQQVAGPDMLGRVAAMHAIMRANRAALLSQETVAPRQRTRYAIGSGGGLQSVPDGPPVVLRAERFVYALDQREIGFSGPALTGSRREAWDRGRTDAPSGLYAIAEVSFVLTDPALKYPDDMDTGAVEEKVGFVEAAWSHRSSDAGHDPYRPRLASDSVHSLLSLCPRRPAWLDQPAVKAVPSPGAARNIGEMFKKLEEVRRQTGAPRP